MRIRSVGFIVIVILWMMLSPVGSAVSFYGDSEVVNDNPEILSGDEYESNLTWTSRLEHTQQLVENYSVVAGDHVIINGTFSELLNVTECMLTIWNPETGINATVSNVGSNITFGTYYLDRTNQTYNIIVNGTTNTNDFVIILRENVTICNFFSPNVVVIAPVEVGIDSDIWNLTWSCTDANADDTPYYFVWLSRDAGVTFVLLTHNISSFYYIWDSTDWLQASYMVRVQAFSVDMTSNECSFEDPPESYWPGDYSDGFTPQFENDGFSFPHYLYVSSVDDVTYEYNSQGNSISLTHSSSVYHPAYVEYTIRDNGSIWIEGTISPSMGEETLTINIDGLSIGIHQIQIEFHMSEFVFVNFTINVTSNAVQSTLIPLIALSITVGAIGGIAVIVIFAIYMKTKKKG